MSDPYLGEIRMGGWNFAPSGWALCNGQLLPISQNTALFSLLGTNFGGNGTTNFALPNLQSRVPIHWGTGTGLSPYVIGETGGSETVTLTTADLPQHNHAVNASSAEETTNRPSTAFPTMGGVYATASDGTVMGATMIANTGSNQAHTNLQPFLSVTFVIALEGIYPSRN